MIKMTRDQWLKQGKELFGDDVKMWQFVCPVCNTHQSAHGFMELTTIPKSKIINYLGFSCIGRYTDKMGCDYTCGGLLPLYRKIVT